LFAKGFSKTYLREHYEPIVAAKAKLAVDGLKEKALAGTADLMQWWTFLATDTVGQLGFGESFGMLERGEVSNHVLTTDHSWLMLWKQKTDYIMTLERALVGNGIGAEMPWIRAIGRLIPAKVPQQMFDATNYILDYGHKAVVNAKSQASETNLMANVLKEGEKENSSLDDLDVRVEATSLIFAGSGTTANTLSYFIWSVLKRPELQRKLEEEVAVLSAGFKDADMEPLPWLNATMQETLRVYAAVPGTLPRVVPKGGITIAGHYLPEGSTVGTQAYTMHRKEDIWPDAHM
jgi:cytochrome P450